MARLRTAKGVSLGGSAAIGGSWDPVTDAPRAKLQPPLGGRTPQRDRTARNGNWDSAGQFQQRTIQSAAPSFGMELSPIDVRDAGEIERAVTAFARGSNDGLVVTAGPLGTLHRELIIALAARHRLPAVYPSRFFATGGGLISYGPNSIDPHRRAAVNRRKFIAFVGSVRRRSTKESHLRP
jgi:hypothetical protein